MDDLFKALEMFQQGVQRASVHTAINEATSAMDQIQQSAVDDSAKRQQFQQLANQTALRLTGSGANGQQIQSAFNAIAPPNFGSAEQLGLEGALSGNQQYQDIAKQDKQQASMAALNQKLFQHKLDLNKIGVEANYKMQGTALEAKLKSAELKPLEIDAVKEIAGLNKDIGIGTKLLSKVSDESMWSRNNPMFASLPWTETIGPQGASLTADIGRFTDAYVNKITGAGVGVEERANLMKNIPNKTDNADTFRSKMKSMVDYMREERGTKLATYGAANRDVRGLQQMHEKDMQSVNADKAQVNRLMQFRK